MTKLAGAPSERLATYFVDYLYGEYRGSRHVRRVAAWVGLIVLGIERLAGHNWRIPRDRQLRFDCAGSSYKAKYNHLAGRRGGIDIVEVLQGRGAPEGKTVTSIRSLTEAQRFYDERSSGLPWP